MRYRAVLAYDGSAYLGFQRQASGATVQAVVESALAVISGQLTGLLAAGRTDAGVHATGQVISFDMAWMHDESTLCQALNANLPYDVAVQSVERVRDDFHPRYDALARRYRYTVLESDVRQPLLARHTWQVPPTVDLAAMHEAAALLKGRHDFAAFGTPPQGDSTVRELFHSEWQSITTDSGRQLIYTVEATAFLYHMVRRLVGMMVGVGRGRLTTARFAAIFRGGDLAQSKLLAPPQGLVLVGVRYPDEARGSSQACKQNNPVKPV